MTGVLEIVSPARIVVPAVREVGMVLRATIIALATLTVLRRREFSYTPPLSLFAALLVIAATTG